MYTYKNMCVGCDSGNLDVKLRLNIGFYLGMFCCRGEACFAVDVRHIKRSM